MGDSNRTAIRLMRAMKEDERTRCSEIGTVDGLKESLQTDPTEIRNTAAYAGFELRRQGRMNNLD